MGEWQNILKNKKKLELDLIKNKKELKFQKIKIIQEYINEIIKFETRIKDLEEILLIINENELEIIKEIKEEIKSLIIKQKQIKNNNLVLEENNYNECFLEIHAGAGG